ncbi:response regulator transcription factor [Amycolatopsis sp. H20-H5]|uniref:response regulator transcription factor n=1 Tax=Amycolatopsis sp. H20-H5 TaxID=3046309 RepID=UPI002DBA2F7D|nr:response regulator transcription factor [Amycolatopsis sp. H20-H5]MEC3980515.1 response regulator transcription factor [Amycolatopsis sp. H20-H5]
MKTLKNDISVVVVDKHRLFRQGIIQILSVEEDISVVGECGFGKDAITVVGQAKPDVVLLDSDRGGSQAVGMLRGLLLVSPGSKVVVVTVHDAPRLVGDLIAAGAHAYVLKNATREELLVTLRTVYRDSGHVVVSVPRETLRGMNEADHALLSRRETEVLELVAGGMRNSQIANELYISEGTVKRHLTNAYTKLGAESRIGAVKKAISLGIVSFNELLEAEEERMDW